MSRIHRLAVVAVLAGLAGPALAASGQGAAFDLVCTGQSTLSDVIGFSSTPFGAPSKIERRFRVDLQTRRWCEGECSGTHELKSVTDTQIIFSESESTDSDQVTAVSRENGHFVDRTRIISPKVISVFMTDGTCARADFSGFPKLLF